MKCTYVWCVYEWSFGYESERRDYGLIPTDLSFHFSGKIEKNVFPQEIIFVRIKRVINN